MKFKSTTNRRKNGKSRNVTKAKGNREPRIRIERPVFHIGKGISYYRTHFVDLDGNGRWVDVPRKVFNSIKDASGFLLNEHARLPNSSADQKQCLEKALNAIGGKPTLRITDRVGWDTTDGERSFVYFGKTIGSASDTLQLDADSNRNPALGKRAGSLEAWRAGLEEPCKHSDHLVLALGIAASGPLYGIIGDPEPCIFHFQGARKPVGDERIWTSTSGKTMTARCAQSMFGACGRTDLHGFNMTRVALEETCFSSNNLVIVLDEEGVSADDGGVKPIDRKSLPYLIVNGQGRRRSKSYSAREGLANRSWVVPVITTSEDALDVTRSDRRDGAKVRMVAVPFPPTWAGGTFARLPSQAERNRLAKQVEATIYANFGTAMPKLLFHLVKHQADLPSRILKIRDDFVSSVVPTGNKWEERYAEKFGMALAGALILATYELAPWSEERAIAAVTSTYKASRATTVSISQATDRFLEKLSRLISAGKRFPAVEKGMTANSKGDKKPWGVVREIDGKRGVTVLTVSRLKRLVEPSAVAEQVLQELKTRKVLISGADGHLTRQIAIMGLSTKRRRYVCIKPMASNRGSN